MKQIIVLVFLLPIFTIAQVNINFLGQLDLVNQYNSEGNDIWGWVDGSGNEYAIVGLNDGTSVVDVTNPAAPVEVFYEPGMNSIWRDMKTYNGYAYVTTEAQNGLLIIDLNTLPGNTNLTTSYYNGPVGEEWQSAHNLYIDENGICYIFGANRDNGGAIMLDLNTDPINPTEVGAIENWYVHDGMARGDTLYLGHISDGHMSIWDVADKANPVLLGQQNTPGNFSHNLWVSDDGDHIYTTDEITNGYIGELDISDPLNIVETDRIQSSPGQDVIPHNAHFMNDYIITSYYRDGITIHDVSNHGNMVEVGNYDTSPMSGDGFNGAWGVYPWLPSGNIIVCDIETGLYILGPTYVRGCYLEGNVTDQVTTGPINGVSVEIVTSGVFDQTSIVGDYATGYSTPGTYDVIYSHPAYFDDTIFGVTLTNGVVTTQDVQLVPFVSYNLTVEIRDILNNPIENAEVLVVNNDFTYSGTTDANGEAIFTGFYDGTYNIFASKWGYNPHCMMSHTFTGAAAQTYPAFLADGYFDDFNLDMGWTVSGGAPDGIWEMADPVGTNFGGGLSNPEDDVADCGVNAYVTGNGGGQAGTDDVDQADAILTSPTMDLTGYNNPSISYSRWWLNAGGQGTPDDTLTVYVTDGITTMVVEQLTESSSDDAWVEHTFWVTDFVTLTADVQVIFATADWAANQGHLVEAGVDQFYVQESLSITPVPIENIRAFPNPGNGTFSITIGDNLDNALLEVYDITGKLVLNKSLIGKNGINTVQIDNAGVCLFKILHSNDQIETIKVVNL